MDMDVDHQIDWLLRLAVEGLPYKTQVDSKATANLTADSLVQNYFAKLHWGRPCPKLS